MTQDEKREYLIKTLLAEYPKYEKVSLPKSESEQEKLLRTLFNVRMPKTVSDEFMAIQNEYLSARIRKKGITSIDELKPIEKDIYLWQGDITTLKCDAVVNAANSKMLGCFFPCHGCIDNAIHTYSGLQLRLKCAEIMKNQGHPEPVGKAKITPGYNLPCKYIIHTVGPTVQNELTQKHCELLASCYRSCLETAQRHNLKSIAFCCISTGEFNFPNLKAAEIAVKTVKDFKKKTKSEIEVIFNVFKDSDYKIYRELFRKCKKTER